MNPQIVKNSVIEDNGEYRFTLKDIHRSLANGIRRIILSEIPAVVFSTENYEDANCKIEINTGRLHNEILRQRLGCIPIYEKVPMKEGETDLDLAGELLEKALVAVVPGSVFEGRGHIRLSYATSRANIEKGVGRIAEFFAARA
jgi:DNA-directed RNA polymerase alpha subunit